MKHKALLACRSLRSELHAASMGIPLRTRESGWAEAKCERCGDDVWIGPQQQNVVVDRPDVDFYVACLICAAKVANAQEKTPNMVACDSLNAERN
jgi:hypothetical protein